MSLSSKLRASVEDRVALLLEKNYHVIPRTYEAPVPEKGYWNRERSQLVGVDIKEEVVHDTLKHIVMPYMKWFDLQFPWDNNGKGFHPLNNTFPTEDAYVYYAFIRHFKPKQIIEIGSGNSTLLAKATIGAGTSLKVIDLPQKVQNTDLSVFESLEENDILFIDSSHVLTDGGDIWFLYCEVLPRLRRGVLVHFHDIGLPVPYPEVYFDRKLYYNEQYVLQTFLAFNGKFVVLWPEVWMILNYPDLMNVVFFKIREWQKEHKGKIVYGSSFWIRRL